MKDFVIVQLGWIKKSTKRHSEHQKYRESLLTFVDFLQDHGLLMQPLLKEGQEVDDSLALRKSDLTDESWNFVHRYYDRWVGAQDRGTPPTDTQMLERGLKQMRAEAAGSDVSDESK